MEVSNELGLDSPSRNSYIGSYYQPPDIRIPLPRRLDFPFHSVEDLELPTTSHCVSQPKSNIDSKGVVDAVKILQEKMSHVVAEISRHEKSREISQESSINPVLTSRPTTHYQQPKKERDAVIKCKTLQKHLEETRRNIERAKKEQSMLLDNQTLLQKQQFNTSIELQNAKLEKLESKYEKLSNTQTESERKLAMLEEELHKEQHERRLVQEKAEELQREFDGTLRISTEEMKAKKKTKKISKKALKQIEQKSPSHSFCQKMPFVAGTSTSPSHSVHANVQTILHLMKHHHPQLHERVSVLHKPVSGVRKGLHRDFSNSESSGSETSLGSLSDLLLALQDELGQMSFEHRELMHQIDGTIDHKKRQDLKNELEQLVSKMEEKGGQITKLRKHQQMIHKMAKDKHQASDTERTTMMHHLAPSPVKPRRKTSKQPQGNLQLLRETQQFRNSLKQSDLFWET